MTAISTPKAPMRAPEFLAWAETQPSGRYELAAGEVVAMAPERVRHNLAKAAVYSALKGAVRAAGAPCTVFTDGVSVIIDEETVREPDASVQCGVQQDLDALAIESPLIVVEVTSPSSDREDTGAKLIEYFSVPSIRHYLIVAPDKRIVVHHAKLESGEVVTRLVRDGRIALDPPGLSIDVVDILGSAQ